MHGDLLISSRDAFSSLARRRRRGLSKTFWAATDSRRVAWI